MHCKCPLMTQSGHHADLRGTPFLGQDLAATMHVLSFGGCMRRREFITLLGGAAATWPIAAHAQQTGIPVIGFLSSRSPGETAKVVAAFQDGLSESGHIVGRDVTIEFRWAEGQYDRLPPLAADLVRRPVTIIAAVGGSVSAFAAKAATTALPIVFAIGDMEPVEGGLVASLNRPGGNITGVFSLNSSLGPKRLELLHEVAPKAAIIGMLVIQIIGMLRYR